MERVSSATPDSADVGHIPVIPAILQVVSRTTGLRFAALARATDSGWTACAVHDEIGFGLEPGDRLPLDTTIGNEIRLHRRPVLIGHVSADEKYRAHPAPGPRRFESCVSIPIVLGDGRLFGTLCALDPQPAKLDDGNTLKILELLAQLAAARIETKQQLAESGQALLDAQEKAKLREQFVAILGHDLRNPLQAIIMGAEMLQTSLEGARDKRILADIRLSCARMVELIHNVMDFAEGRMGEGLAIQPEPCADLAANLQHVVTEIRRAYPEQEIVLESGIAREVKCDRRRIAQLLGNLLSNAVKHGDGMTPVRVALRSDDDAFELSVENGGKPIPAHKVARLFQPFTRGESPEPRQGLGLGLYIANEIAKAHGGVLSVSSDATATRFAFRMPLRATAEAPAVTAAA